jgi:Fe-S-cluster-containing hydrogenase component 2
VEIPVRGEALFRALERPMAFAERSLGRWLPEAWNPLLQAGAIANTSLILAIASGVLLLLWYVPSVHQAHGSVAAMADAPWTAGLVRGVHRYSSDATILFGAWHGLRLALARRFTGPRWLAWVTGLGLLAALGLVGWLGYWLLWDEAARQIAIGTARLADALPLFAEPLSRSFLVDEMVNSLLFFVVFFVHMLLPLALAVLLWLHIGRVARSRFFPSRAFAGVIVGLTVALALAVPAALAAPAVMTSVPERFLVDAWFLWPLLLTDRLGAGALWALILGGGAVAFAVPWLLAKGTIRVATVHEGRCNACNLCTIDCPYDAIQMVKRSDGKAPATRAERGEASESAPEGRAFIADGTPLGALEGAAAAKGGGLVAQVDAAKCVGCGICSGSCDGGAIGLDQFPQLGLRKRVDGWLDAGDRSPVAFVCGCAGSGDVPGHRTLEIPCAGWLHTLSIERALRHGAPSVTVVTCAEGQCRYREGDRWLRERVEGRRAPALRAEKIPPGSVTIRAAGGQGRPPHAWGALVPALAVAMLLVGVTALGSFVPYAVPGGDEPQLVVSFVHPGEAAERCRAPTEEEQAARPVHMRAAQICERARPDVRLKVTVDGEVVREASVAAGGLWGDGASVALERVAVPAGKHRVAVAIGDRPDGQWTWTEEREVDFAPRSHRVILFDRRDGFEWFPVEAP